MQATPNSSKKVFFIHETKGTKKLKFIEYADENKKGLGYRDVLNSGLAIFLAMCHS